MKDIQNQINLEMKKRFDSALDESVSSDEVNQFRRLFEQSWSRRTFWGRIAGKPLNVFLLGAVIVFVGIGTSYSLMLNKNSQETGLYAGPVLMPGQHIVDDPGLVALFPKIEHPTLISNQSSDQPEKSSFMIHGYLEDDIQVVWKY
ncbi:MAG: hypothetical protein P9L94_12410 [Candidatus Hinthialibacter antarcticus]|nr:hypothetical protein [Candidatus Hinthialibacter antarcticus]